MSGRHTGHGVVQDRLAFEYFNDPPRPRRPLARRQHEHGRRVGYVDDDGYLYLTDRATFMIISGGVNIYPQECETC